MSIPAQLDLRFRDAAADEGLLEVGYDVVDSPLGPLYVAVSQAGLCFIEFDPEPELETEHLSRVYGARIMASKRQTDAVRRQLDEYFDGKRRRFELPVDLRLARDFGRRVLAELVQVPYGELTSYGELAARAGHPRAARAVGTVMNRNPVPIVVPCHRVVGSTGALVGYGGGLDRKLTLLRLEGSAPAA